ncbi:MAG: serine hydrolase [Gemmatimonadaceae bacterium]
MRQNRAMKFSLLLVTASLAVAEHAALAQSSPAHDSLTFRRNSALLWNKLEASVARVERAHDGLMGVAIRDLVTGQVLAINADELFPTASTIKIAILAELVRADQRGRVHLADAYTVSASDVVGGSDIMEGLTPGVTRLTLRDLATMMVAVSDNSATNVLIDRLGADSVNALLVELGLKETRLRRKMMDLKAAAAGRENTATPRELVTLLAALHHGTVLGAKGTDAFFALLSTHKNSQIARVLPDTVRVATKPGDLDGVRNDCGVVFAPRRPFAICVMTTFDHDARAAEDAISEVAAAAYSYFERVGTASAYGRRMP